MQMPTEKIGDVVVVTVPGKHLDARVAEEFKRDMAPVLEANSRIVFDMGQLRFVDSAGIGAILSCLRRLNAKEGDRKLCGVSKPVRASFEVARMHRISDILGTREEAGQAFESGPAGAG